MERTMPPLPTENHQVISSMISGIKPVASQTPPACIILSIASQDGMKTHYQFKRSKQIKSLLMIHCKKYSIDYETVVFLYNGRKIKIMRTPDELGMGDCDEIQLMIFKTGG